MRKDLISKGYSRQGVGKKRQLQWEGMMHKEKGARSYRVVQKEGELYELYVKE